MLIRPALLTLGVLVAAGGIVRAQPVEMPAPNQGLSTQGVPPGGYPATAGPSAAPDYSLPLTGYPDPMGEPPWCDSPYRSSAWRLEVGLIPTVSHVSEQAFGDWSDDGALALRLGLGYEGFDGFGTRVQFWGIGDDQDTPVGEVDLGASTFYWDFYKRFFVEHAELVLGGGLAGAGLEYDLKTLHQRATLSAGGLSIFGEGFYPIWRWAKTDIGSIGRARVALLSGQWNDRGTTFVDDSDHDLMTLIELAWGLEIRRRFGQREDKYWYIDIVPEFQRWESSSLPNEFDPGFQGTAINFGLAW